jgi:hypothetical protein
MRTVNQIDESQGHFDKMFRVLNPLLRRTATRDEARRIAANIAKLAAEAIACPS